MSAAVLFGEKRLRVETVPVPAVRRGSILIRVHACGVCGSDLRIYHSGNPRVRCPAIMGHEIAGEVVALGEGVKGYRLGDRVSVGADIPCQKCDWCRQGESNCCETNLAMGYQFSGAFAEYCLLDALVVNGGPLARIPASVSYEEAAIAEALGCCINGIERVGGVKGKSVLVIGAGPIGLMLLSLARAFFARKVAIADLEPRRLAFAKRFEPKATLFPARKDWVMRAAEWTGGRGVDRIFTACPVPDVQEKTLACLAKRGVVNFFGGLAKDARPIRIHSNILHYKEATLTGSHGSTPRQHRMALQMIASRKVPVRKLISHRYKLQDLLKAFALVQGQKGMKAIIQPSSK